MIFILTVIAGLLTAFGIFHVAQAALFLPSGKAVNAIQNIYGRRSLSGQLQRILLPLAGLLSRLFPMSEYKTKQMEADFDRLNLKQTPKEYSSGLMTKSLLLTVIGLIFIPLGVPWLFLIVAVIALLSYFRGMQSVRNKVEELNQAIEAELPRLVETLNYSVQDNRDLLSFFEKYRKVSGRELGVELDRIIVDMKTGNQEAALRRMDARLGIPSFAALCAILCGVNQGVDQKVSLLVLEQDMRTKERETLRRNMEKSPGRIKAASFILTILMIIMFMIPFVLLIMGNLQAAGF